jgi:hypothetical protein
MAHALKSSFAIELEERFFKNKKQAWCPEVSMADLILSKALKPDDIMKRMRIDEFKRLGKIWTGRPEGIGLAHFMLLICNFAEHQPEERLNLMIGTTKLFTEIDVNGDGTVEWSEFVQYVNDQVKTVINRRPGYGFGATSPNYLIKIV